MDTFPRQYARTRRFSLGEPKSFRIAPDGQRVVFLRSGGGSDPVNQLWVAQRRPSAPLWDERCVADPALLFGGRGTDSDLPAAERARRERLREQANGITAFDVNDDVTVAVFTLAGMVVMCDLDAAESRVIETSPGAYDAHPSPNGSHVAYVSNRCLRVVAVTGAHRGEDRLLAGEDREGVGWGVADFIAAEELNRYRGFWWSPDSAHIVAARVDESPLRTWYISDPANPSREPAVHRYPPAGTDNAVVTLSVINVETGRQIAVASDHEAFPYLLSVQWTKQGLFAVWLNRTQTQQRLTRIETSNGTSHTLLEQNDPIWIELVPGTPHITSDGGVITTVCTHVERATAAGFASPLERHSWEDPERTSALAKFRRDGTFTLLSPANLQVRKLVQATDSTAIVIANASRAIDGLALDADPAQLAVLSITEHGPLTVLAGGSTDPGVHDIVVAATALGPVTVVRSVSIDRAQSEVTVRVGNVIEHRLANHAEVSLIEPKPFFFRAGDRALPCCVFLPTGSNYAHDLTKFPVLLDPYGGPHAQRVVAVRNAHTTSQWFADQGFVVLVIDGRGTPGLGPDFDQAVHGNLADPVLEDQLIGLGTAAERFPQMDLDRVGIRGWSFGGYLAALAVLKRPDVFHAAVAGAPVTEWRLYDTGYTERYLGNPSDDARAYERSSLIPLAKDLRRPLMLIHGLADDNVVAAHTLQLSSALLAHGRAHEVLPLSGVTHMTPQEEVAENLLLLQVDFLKRSLASPIALT